MAGRRSSKLRLLVREGLRGFEYRQAARDARRKVRAVQRARRLGAFDRLELAEETLAGFGLSPGRKTEYGMTFLRVIGIELAYAPDGNLSWQGGHRTCKTNPVPQMDLFTALPHPEPGTLVAAD